MNADVGSGRETPPGFHMETLEARGLLTKANLHGKMRMESERRERERERDRERERERKREREKERKRE